VVGLRFVQLSDLRWGGSARLLETELGGALWAAHRSDANRVLERLVVLVREHRADLVLLPGNVLDDSRASPEQMDRLQQLFAELAPRGIFVGPGELDAPHKVSYLGAASLVGGPSAGLPVNVTVFGTTPRTHMHGAVAVTGWASGAAGSRPVAAGDLYFPQVAHATHHLVVAHTVPPFVGLPKPDQLAARGIRYVALGNQAETAFEKDAFGSVRTGWAGHPVAHAFAGRGPARAPGGILLGEIDPDGVVRVQRVSSGARAARRVDWDVTGIAPLELAPALERRLEEESVGPIDLVEVVVCGRWPGLPLPDTLIKESGLEGTFFFNLETLSISPPSTAASGVPPTRQAHLAGILSRAGSPATRLEAYRLSGAAWDGTEVKPSGEDPADPL
jgi:hypothetical protein